MNTHEPHGLTAMGQIDARTVAQSAIADIEGRNIRLRLNSEALLVGKPGVLLAIHSARFGSLGDNYIIDVGVDDALERFFTVDLLNGEDVRIEQPYVTADAGIIDRRTLDRWITSSIDGLTVLGV